MDEATPRFIASNSAQFVGHTMDAVEQLSQEFHRL